jgi:transcription antitermination factor NusG
MNNKKPRKLTSEEMAAIKNSPLFAKKRKEAEIMFNSPAYLQHAKARHRKRQSTARKNAKVEIVSGAYKVVVGKKKVQAKASRRQVA